MIVSLLESWSSWQKANSETVNDAPLPQASSFHFDAVPFLSCPQRQTPEEIPMAARFEPADPSGRTLLASFEINCEGSSTGLADRAPSKREVNSSTPLSQIYDIIDVQSKSSRWLAQRGYLEPFKSPDCRLDLNFGSDGQGSKVAVVLTAPNGARRTVVALEGGVSFQRITGANGQELVKFLSSGQIVEFNPNRQSA
jgi:hypothetical protein